MNSPKPEWLRVGMPSGEEYFSLVRLLKQNNLHTVCQEANCPNVAECFGRGRATFLILGSVCTRSCGYCNVRHGAPDGLDSREPERVARAVGELGLRRVGITSVTRDDLEDGGASAFSEAVHAVRKTNLECKIEVLIPDFKGDKKSLRKVIDAGPDVLGHNLETVRRMFPIARRQGDYDRSLNLLREAHKSCTTKSGFMVGLGEAREEIVEAMEALHDVADILTICQYLQPSLRHLNVVKYYTPGEFKEFEELGLSMGFRHVESRPLVRCHEFGS